MHLSYTNTNIIFKHNIFNKLIYLNIIIFKLWKYAFMHLVYVFIFLFKIYINMNIHHVRNTYTVYILKYEYIIPY